MKTESDLEKYGFRLLPNGRFFSIRKSIELGVVHSRERGRSFYRSASSGSLLASGMSPVEFVKRFWYATATETST